MSWFIAELARDQSQGADMQSEYRGDVEHDRRWSARKPVAQNVAIYYNRLGLLPCKILNISMEGMFVYTGRITLTTNTKVDAVLTSHNGKESQQLRLPAKIVRVNPEGAGLRFHSFDSDTYYFLREILNNN
jgi:hypothetical protein